MPVSKVGSLTIPNGSNVSNILDANGYYEDSADITLYAPAALDALTFTIEVTDAEPPVAGSTWRTCLQDNTTTDLAPPAAGKARKYKEMIAASGFRIKASGNVAADRVFAVTVRTGY